MFVSRHAMILEPTDGFLMKLSMNVMPLESTQLYQYYQLSDRENL